MHVPQDCLAYEERKLYVAFAVCAAEMIAQQQSTVVRQTLVVKIFIAYVLFLNDVIFYVHVKTVRIYTGIVEIERLPCALQEDRKDGWQIRAGGDAREGN
jgi:hypothetical protein